MAKTEYSEQAFHEMAEEARAVFIEGYDEDPIARVEAIYQLWRGWADFHLFVVSPTILVINPPVIHHPEMLSSGDNEFVYDIHDFGYRLSTSKACEMLSVGMSMCKLYYTIEKMIFLLIERLKSGGIDEQTEVQISFAGHELAQRKAFESVINLSYNVVVTNFEPGAWGDQFLANVKRLADKGYGYPAESPREIYRHSKVATISSQKK